jgi:hypothetical protein
MAFVALCIVAIISMAALSIDIGTLYEAKGEAQRAADLAVLAAARIISIEGLTGDPTTGPSDGSWNDICGGLTSPASLAAINVAQQNLINGSAAPTADILVTYGTSAGAGVSTNCTGAGVGFTVNPVVQVVVKQPNLPTFFARIFSLVSGGSFLNSGVSATATAEVFNSSGTGSLPSGMVPVLPRCVKPLIIPNVDPTPGSSSFFNADGTITKPGIAQLGGGVIGEVFTLAADCNAGQTNCRAGGGMIANPPQTGAPVNTARYVPALVTGTPIALVSGGSCSLTNTFQQALAGCDESTVYSCGTPSTDAGATQVNLNENPLYPTALGGDESTAVQCLTGQVSGGADSLSGFIPPSTPPTYPFQILAGFGNPLVKAGVANNNNIITVSNSIATIPVYDGTALGAGNQPPVTIVGFLQVFINQVNGNGTISVTVMNVNGCGNGAGGPPTATVSGTSPVPIRLITPP